MSVLEEALPLQHCLITLGLMKTSEHPRVAPIAVQQQDRAATLRDVFNVDVPDTWPTGALSHHTCPLPPTSTISASLCLLLFPSALS